MSEHLGRFAKAMVSELPRDWRGLFFGDRSEVALGLQDLGDNPSSRRDELKALTKRKVEFRRRLLCDDAAILTEIDSVPNRLIAALEVATNLMSVKASGFGNPEWRATLKRNLEVAIAAFGEMWSRDNNAIVHVATDPEKAARIDPNNAVE